MDNLNINYDKNWHSKSRIASITPRNEQDLCGKFPLSIYFQTHFQYIHENNQNFHNELKLIKEQLTLIEVKLNRLLKDAEKNIK